MSQKLKIFIGILAAFMLVISWSNFAEAQVPSVPKPTCVEVPGGPSCPKDWKTNIDTSFPIENIKKNANKILDDLLKSYRELEALFNKWVAIETVRWISDFFGGLDKKLQNLFR